MWAWTTRSYLKKKNLPNKVAYSTVRKQARGNMTGSMATVLRLTSYVPGSNQPACLKCFSNIVALILLQSCFPMLLSHMVVVF